MENAQRYSVGIGELRVSDDPEVALIAHGLGILRGRRGA